MRGRGSRLVAGIAVLVALTALAYGLAHWRTDTSMWARIIAWGDADVGDQGRFPARVIAHTPGAVWRLHAPRDRSAYDRLWAPLRIRRDRGTDTVPLDTLLASTGTRAFLVLLGDTVLTERYFAGYGPDSLHTSFSAAKAILALLVGVAVAEGAIAGPDAPIGTVVPELAARDPRLAAITWHHLLTMASGLRWNDTPAWGDPARTYYAPDLRASALRVAWAHPPGTTFRYNNYNPLLVGLGLERATGRPVARYLEDRIWRRIGAAGPASWNVDSDRHGFEKMESGFNARADDYARLGLLVLRGGRRDSVPLVPADWLARATRVDSVGDPSARYQYFWWTDPQAAPPPPFWAEGRFGQFVWISPADSLVIVRLGADDGDLHWPSLFSALASRLEREQP